MAHSEGSAQLVRLEGKVGDPARLYKVGLAAPSSPEIRGLQIARFVQSPFPCIGIFRLCLLYPGKPLGQAFCIAS